jgi:hypothetical protein
MVSVASRLIEKVTAHAQMDSLEDVREICADGTYFPSNLPTSMQIHVIHSVVESQQVRTHSICCRISTSKDHLISCKVLDCITLTSKDEKNGF